MTTTTYNPIARALEFDPVADWIGIRRDGHLIAVIQHLPSHNGYDPAEGCYARQGHGFTPNNPCFSVYNHIDDADVRCRFAQRFVGDSAPFSIEAERQDPQLRTKVVRSALEAEFLAQ